LVSHYVALVVAFDSRLQISLPPLIENEKGRKLVASTLEKSRASFRKFRDSLSEDIATSRGKQRWPRFSFWTR